MIEIEVVEADAEKQAKNIIKAKSCSSPFVTDEVLIMWIKNAILSAYHRGQADVHKEHMIFHISKMEQRP